ncbi:PTS sugar transporter subunit IIB [Thermophilibacter sp. ET337]|uniref:PTS sugar transporter subunit IIB n=1 Tax=Thermophilibacter sp. ET337 TaxID=2973084 RepID=UPI0021AD33E3|nr:PTS sugar transporter subunit IIB [Thermophilibacter sp. ET337]MCR8907172.1 PTS sugar transporter subunit IIB [Thermophilibacter sp. ET337]
MKIMLCCNAGMSTSLLVQKMQKEAASRGQDVTIEARPMNEAMDHIDEADVILLGPQIGYAKGDFEKAVNGRCPVTVIPMVDYGRMNAAKILDDVAALLG